LKDELLNLPPLHRVQEILNVVRLSIREFRVQRQPSLEVLFRTEEVVDSSTAAQKNLSYRRVEFLDPGVFENQVDSLAAVLTCIVYCYRLVFQFSADQQHEINRSIDLEGFFTLHLHAMIHEGNAHGSFPVLITVLGHAIAETLHRRIGPHDSETLQHFQSVGHSD